MTTKNKLKSGKEVSKVFTGTEVGVLLEHIDDKVTLIAEQYGDLKNGQKEMHKQIDTLNKRVDYIADTVGVLKEDVSVLKEDVGVLKEDVATIKMDIEMIKHDLKNKISRDEFAILERRVALLESRR